ncbi:MAG TPA: DHA2 family efflux MFS transporter permease subunit [Candidatus Limnocylindria bacterium]|nr:DHA2 family efflux MFS transporter permease subunit [Candidatus Limnocylindria bacterium]
MHTAPASLVESGYRRGLIVTGVMLAALLMSIDATIVNVALPTIEGNLGASVDEGTWVLTAYVIANVVVIPLTPWLQLRFGRKPYFLTSIIGFTLASLACGMAPSLGALILFRLVQGAFGGGILATAQVVLRETFPPEQLGTSQAIYAMGVVLGPSVGPTLGGLITDNMSWRWVFDVNLVPGAIAVALLWRFLRPGNPGRPAPVDYVGVLLLIVTVGSMQYVLDQGQTDDWFSNQLIVVFTVTAVVGVISFAWWELRHRAPIVDLRVLRHVAVAVAPLMAVANALTFYGGMLLLPQFTVDQLGWTSTAAGFLVGSRGIPIWLITFGIGRLANARKFDMRILIAGGLLLSGIASIWLSRTITTGSTSGTFLDPWLLGGIGSAMIYTPLLLTTQRAVVPAEAPKAASFVTLFNQLGGSIGSATLVTLVDRREQMHLTTLGSNATLGDPTVATFVHEHSAAVLANLIGQQAMTLSYADAFLVSGCIGLAFTPLAWFLVRSRKQTA